MKISEVNIVPIKPKDGLVAFASVVLDNSVYLGSVGIFTRLDGTGYRITYPTKKIGYKDLNIYHPITKEFGQQIEAAILKKVAEIFNQ